MSIRWPEDELMCQTSESTETTFTKGDLLLLRKEVSDRIHELFHYQKLSELVFHLRSNPHELGPVLNGEVFPPTELLLGIQKITGASIDWILTGRGEMIISSEKTRVGPRVINAVNRFRREFPRMAANQY